MCVVVRRCLDNGDIDNTIVLAIHPAQEAFFARPEAFAWITETATRYATGTHPHQHELLGAAGLVA